MKVNLVLSGGGVRGFAHLGVIKALTSMGIEINSISGTSSGAVVGAFIAAGFHPDETLKLMNEYHLLKLLRGAFQGGIFSMRNFEKIYNKCFPSNSFEALNFPLIISATNFAEGKTVYFSSGKLIPPLLASTAVPVLFRPIEYQGFSLLDGGILNNLPVEPFLDQALPIIGIHVNSVQASSTNISTLKIMERSFNLAVYSNVIERMNKCSLVIEPPGLGKYPVYAYSKAEEIFHIGYKYTMNQVKEIESALLQSER